MLFVDIVGDAVVEADRFSATVLLPPWAWMTGSVLQTIWFVPAIVVVLGLVAPCFPTQTVTEPLGAEM
jgi:hypothetical protein